MRTRSLTPVVAVVVVMMGSSCLDHPAAAEPEVIVSVNAPAARYDPNSISVRATLPVTIANNGAETVHFLECGMRLERKIGSSWRGVWSTACLLEQLPTTLIGPGEQIAVQVTAYAVLGRDLWHDPVNGEYRVHVAIWDTKGRSLEKASTSRPFTLLTDTVR